MIRKNIFRAAIACFCVCLFSCTTPVTGLGVKDTPTTELIMPDGGGPFPAVLILHASSGVISADLDYAKMLARNGYACFISHYFEARNINYSSRGEAVSIHAEAILRDLVDTLENLKKNPKVDKDKLGAVGFSMGGYWAMVLAAKGYVQAGVSNYGVLTAIGQRNPLRYEFGDIFNEKSSPVLILHGANDTTQPVAGAHRLSAILEQKYLAYEKHIYPSAGHSFDRGEYQNSTVASDSRDRTLEFLDKYVKKNLSKK